MADYSKQIFEMLGVEPNEKFEIDGRQNEYTFCLTEKLEVKAFVRSDGQRVSFFVPEELGKLLSGFSKIIKTPHYSDYQQRQIDAAVLLGYPWWARDENGKLVALREKPSKSANYWATQFNSWIDIPEKQGEEFTNINWEDDEPHYFGGDEE